MEVTEVVEEDASIAAMQILLYIRSTHPKHSDVNTF